jgi:hypothetical protein
MIIRNLKNYKIIVDSKHFENMRGASPAEVAKKAASKILGNSLNRKRFSTIEAKTGKIRHYDVKLEDLVRPYHKNEKLVKYRIIVKKIGKQVGGTYPPNLDEDSGNPIFDFFPREEYKIEIEEDEYIIIKNRNNKKCIEFYIYNSTLYLEEINKCDYSGKINLEKLIEYAKILKTFDLVETIELTDQSTIFNKKISLWLLSILSTGESWYNHFKFFQRDYKYEKEYNQSKIIMKFEDFINECIELLIKKYDDWNKNNTILKNAYRNILNEQKDNFFKYYNKEKSVQEIFTEIKNKLKDIKYNKSLDLKLIVESLNFIKASKIIKYSDQLYLHI